MKDITNHFGSLYRPIAALVFYQSEDSTADTCVEYFDIGQQGMPINAHPLTVREGERLAKALAIAKQKKDPALKSKSIIGTSILHLNDQKGRVIWYTKAMQRKLFFTDELELLGGTAHVPAMLWVADRRHLSVYALKTNARPSISTKLYHAPFFNLYKDGRVCLGTVDIDIRKDITVEDFTATWEDYFFNSYFSHLLEGHNPVRGNCAQLWASLIATGEPFPKTSLSPSPVTLKNLL